MKERCVIQDVVYWDLILKDGEIPLSWACTEWSLRMRTKEGFILGLELQEEGFFEVDVILPKGFHHDTLSLSGILEPSTLWYDRADHKYSWHYHSVSDASLFRPLDEQWKHCHASGPVQVMNTCRDFIGELMAKKHKGPDDTFQKNLRWMKQQCLIKNAEYWSVDPRAGDEVPIAPRGNDRSLCLCTKEGFIITISICNNYYRCHLEGSIELPPCFYLSSWLTQHAKYEALNIYVPFLTIDVPYWKGDNTYGWDHANYALDANLALPEASQPVNKCVSGPVQVLEEARQIITAVMMKESELRMNVIREELMMKACHPRRIAAWTEQGF